MISVEKRLLFIHIPKTAGNSIQNVLAPFSEDKKVVLAKHQDGVERFEVRNQTFQITKHSSYLDYKQVYPKNLFDSLFKFTVVRDTYHRAMSYYFSTHRGKIEWNRFDFIELLKQIKPIRYYLALPGQNLADAVGNIDCMLRYEKLNCEFAAMAGKFDLPNTLPHVNRSSLDAKMAFYDEELLSIVRDQFQEEIEFFQFESS